MILLDTHTILWAATENSLLSRRAAIMLKESTETMFVSAATAWEITTKFRLGKLPQARYLLADFKETMRKSGYSFLPITMDHSLLAGGFTMEHKDPFDRMIAAQAHVEKMPLLSSDAAFDQFPITRIW